MKVLLVFSSIGRIIIFSVRQKVNVLSKLYCKGFGSNMFYFDILTAAAPVIVSRGLFG
jgi:hypothetical protein